MLGTWILFVTATVSRQSLPAPTRLLVEYLDGSAPIISTRRPRFSFVPHPQHDHPGDGMAMAAYQIVVSRTTDGAVVWDSSVVNASSATSIKCGVVLDALQTYRWTARWWANDAEKSSPSPTSAAKFVVGPCSEADWEGSRWVGGGLNEFRITFNTTTPSDTLVFVASPGGSLLYTRTPSSSSWRQVGKDAVGVSPWTDFRKMVAYRGYIVPHAKTASSVQQLKLAIGSGFWAPSYPLAGPFWGLPAGKAPVARVMVLGGTVTKIEGRRGVCVSDDPWEGAVMDWGLGDADGWETAPPVPDTPGWRPTGSSVALQAPYAATSPDVRFGFPVHAVSVTVLAPSLGSPTVRRVLYKFDRNIVGHAAVRASAVTTSTEGNLTLRHCEVLNISLGEENSFCLALRHLPDQPDTHMFPKGYRGSSSDDLLSPRFTWHGFQYVIVEVTQGVDFSANIDSLVARWTASDLEDTASIEFSGPGAQQLSQIRDIVKASQVSNMAAFSPTDCPTREKHYWMGDAAVTAEEAMYNYFTPGTYELFLNIIRNTQDTNESSPYFGFVKGVVPEGDGVGPHHAPVYPDDISWTSAYPLIAHWLLQYYGDVGVVEDHWESLKRWTDGQRRKMLPDDGVPSFFKYGDWCAPFDPRAISVNTSGPPSAAANYILSVEAMASMAAAIGRTQDEHQYLTELTQWRDAFHERFWNPKNSSYTNDRYEVQTITAIALGAGAVPAEHHATAARALIDSVAREGHLTVGAVGAKWLFRELTAVGAHDSALGLSLQKKYPSFGYWLSQGATTCFENWSGVCDESHPGTPWPNRPGKYISPNPPTHNHIFLCGGVGEWMYRSLGGISPATPGYEKVSIAPQVSKTEGPSAVNTSITTIRGVVTCNWSRNPTPGVLLEMAVQVPVGSTGVMSMPLLTTNSTTTTLLEVEDNVMIWSAAAEGSELDRKPKWLLSDAQISEDGDRVIFETTAGKFLFRVTEQGGKTQNI